MITPPASENCSSRGSVDIDTRSEGFNIQHISCRYSSENDFYESETEYPVTEACLKCPHLSGLINSFVACACFSPCSIRLNWKILTSEYLDPQTIELSYEPQQMNIEYWNLPPSSDQSQIPTHGALEAPSSMILCGRVYVPINDSPDMSRTSSQHTSYTTGGGIVSGGDQTDLFGISMLNNSTLNVISSDNISLAENEIIKGSTGFLVSGHDTASSPESSSQY